jgi:hypothetical protein
VRDGIEWIEVRKSFYSFLRVDEKNYKAADDKHAFMLSTST